VAAGGTNLAADWTSVVAAVSSSFSFDAVKSSASAIRSAASSSATASAADRSPSIDLTAASAGLPAVIDCRPLVTAAETASSFCLAASKLPVTDWVLTAA
jgi:hypothetical protein